MEDEKKVQKALIDILDRGILDLNEFGIITNALSETAEMDRDKCGCNGDCGCHSLCPASSRSRENIVNPIEYRSKEVEEVMKKIIAAYGPK